jgi:hypothetical protein
MAGLVLAALLPALLSPGARAAAAKAKPKEGKALTAARALFTQCDQRPITGGLLFQCGRLVTSVVDRAGTPAELIDGTLGMVRGLGGDFSMSDAKIAVGDKTLPGVAFAIKAAEASNNISGNLVAFDVGQGTSRAVMCFSSNPTETSEYTCKKMFTALGTIGPAPFVATLAEHEAPSFLGLKIAVPDGCKTVSADTTSFRIACQDGASIFYARARTPKAAEKVAEEFRNEFLKTGTAAPDRPCVLGGVNVTCQVVDGAGKTFYLATATVKGDAVIAICYQEPQLVVVHPVCAEVMSF